MQSHAFGDEKKHLKKITQFELSNLIRKCRIFTKVKLTPSSRLVLESLVYHYPNIKIKIKTISEETGCSPRSVENAIAELKAKGLIIVIQTGRSSIFKLTQTFFDLLEVAHQAPQKLQNRHAEIAVPYKKEKKEINLNKNNKILNFQNTDYKKSEFHNDSHITGIKYKIYKPEKLEKQSPLDMTKEQAINFLQMLPESLQNSFFASELRKKWQL